MLNKCFKLGMFPKIWKTAKVVLFHKEGRDRKYCNSYRPICLLNVWGKLYDKLLTKRLVYFLESRKLINNQQYGFRKGMGSMDAIYSLLKEIRDNKQKDLLSCLITLDIENAFGNAKRCDILKILKRYGLSKGLFSVICSFLGERTAMLPGGGRREYNLGVPQGSSMGPILWFLLANEALNIEFESYVRVQAFADDFVMLIGASACYRFSEVVITPLQRMSDWAEKFGLNFSLEKSKYTVFPLKGIIGRRPTIKLLGHSLKFEKELKYLGVIIDNKLTWIPHLNNVLEKVSGFENKLKQFTRATWGLKPEILKNLYLLATERLVLHGAPIWMHTTERIKTKLHQIQRKSLLSITKCYRTVSTEALQGLAGCPPLDLVATADKGKYSLLHWKEGFQVGNRFIAGGDCERIQQTLMAPWSDKRIYWDKDICDLNWYAYTDAAKSGSSVGCAVNIYKDDALTWTGMFKITDDVGIFEAEAIAIIKMIEYCESSGIDEVQVHSDSKSVLMAVSGMKWYGEIVDELKRKILERKVLVHLHWVRGHSGVAKNEDIDRCAKMAMCRGSVDVKVKYTKKQVVNLLKDEVNELWQNRWSTSLKGRKVFAHFPEISRERVNGDFFLNQIFTGHGAMGPHQERFFGKEPLCDCLQEVSSEEHLIFRCVNYNDIRRDYFPSDFRTKDIGTLVLDKRVKQGVRLLMLDFIQRMCREDD